MIEVIDAPEEPAPQEPTPVHEPAVEPWWHPLGAIDRGTAAWRRTEKRLAHQPLARLTTAAPRTLLWVGGELRRRTRRSSSDGARPPAPMTAAMIAHVAMDEAIMALAVGPNRMPRRADYERVGKELTEAERIMSSAGWLDDPISFHRDPPPLEHPAESRGWAMGRSYERLWWPSAFEPTASLPGAERWGGFEANRTASAWLLRHPEPGRPWVICVHGFGTGTVFMDLVGFHVGQLHDTLGCNVAGIVLPVHGARKPSRLSGEEFLNFDVMNFVHGLSQSVWDVRRLLSWVRRQDPSAVGIFGISLGGLVTELVAAMEPELDLVMAGVPVVDLIDLIRHHAPHHVQLRAIEHHVLDGTAQRVARVVTPMAMGTAVPWEARGLFAGLGDRLVPVEQAHELWEHWEQPDTCWFPGNHVGYLWSGAAWEYLDRRFRERGLCAD